MTRVRLRYLVFPVCAFLLESSAGVSQAADPPADQAAPSPAFALTSPAFTQGARIPQQYSKGGKDLSPPLRWADPPEGTKSFVLICEDPDAPRGTWCHWVLFDLPPELRSLPEGIPAVVQPPGGGRHGVNDFRQPGYGGPFPPPGKPHRYYFRLYALDAVLDAPVGSRRQDILARMKDHILARAEIMGRYQR